MIKLFYIAGNRPGSDFAAESENECAGRCDEPKMPEKPFWRLTPFVCLIACLALGLFCCELNRQLYQHQCPFFDSQSYHIRMFRVMTIAHDQGLAAGLSKACFGKTTVCLPFAIAAAIGTFGVEPNRFVSIWIQTAYLFLLLISLFYYLVDVRRLKRSTSALGCAAFFSAACLYFENGGLSDFRMDLSLCLTFGLTIVWYLTAMAQPQLWRFVVLGVAAAACCLSRGTAPVYLVAAVGPLATIDLLWTRQRKQKMIGLGVAATVIVALSAWFYIGNFDFLYFYYAIWNTDANANIPLDDALTHWTLAWNCIGKYWCRMVVAWVAGLLLTAVVRGQLWKVFQSVWNNREFDLRLVWLGLCPIALMIVRQAGLNPFVCMPAIIGIMLAIMIPLLSQLDSIDSRRLCRFYWVCLLISIGSAAVHGWRSHQQNTFNRMAGHQQILDEMIADSTKYVAATDIRFGVLHVTYLNTQSLYAAMLFDREDAIRRIAFVQFAEKKFSGTDLFNRGAETDWNLIKGQTDQQKIAHLMRAAENQVDYLIIPDEESAKRIQEKTSQNVINRHLVALRSMVVGGGWEKVGQCIQCNQQEFVEIYRRASAR